PAGFTALQIHVLNGQATAEINAAFAPFMTERPGALFVGPSAFFASRRVQLALLTALHRVPAIYPLRQFAEAGGLISYGASLTDAYRKSARTPVASSRGSSPLTYPACSRRRSS